MVAEGNGMSCLYEWFILAARFKSLSKLGLCCHHCSCGHGLFEGRDQRISVLLSDQMLRCDLRIILLVLFSYFWLLMLTLLCLLFCLVRCIPINLKRKSTLGRVNQWQTEKMTLGLAVSSQLPSVRQQLCKELSLAHLRLMYLFKI